MKASLVLCLLIGALVSSPFAATYTIKPDGSGDFPTIQDAIDAASDGDTILLSSGIFSGEGNFDLSYDRKGLLIRSVTGNPNDCIIDCTPTSPEQPRTSGFLFEGESISSHLHAVTVSHATSSAIDIEGASPLITNCVLSYNEAGQGAGIFVYGGSPVISECTFVGNWADLSGGGLCI